jgi:GR25 family glycosyltransferase involved in LPS biosynthesis
VKILCINLPSASDRREKIESQARSLGVEVHFIEAVSGGNLDPEAAAQAGYDSVRRLKREGYDLEPNEIATVLSHRKALQEFLRHKSEEFCLVLEDDAVMTGSALEAINRILEAGLPWDVLKVESRTRQPKGIRVGNIGGTELYVPLRAGFGATALAYSRTGAAKCLKLTHRFTTAYDTALADNWRHDILILQTFPGLINEDETAESTIGGRRGRRRVRAPAVWLHRRCHRIASSLAKRLHALYAAFRFRRALRSR